MLDVQLFGFKPWGHHLTSVLLHALDTALVFLVFRKMTGANWRSAFVAVLFGLHPLRVESVAWISERKDVLSTMFWLLAMWNYACFAGDPRQQGAKARLLYWLAVLFFALGLMSKAMLVTLPFVFLLMDYWPLGRWKTSAIGALVFEKTPFFLLATMVGWISFLAQRNAYMTMSLPLGDRLENAAIAGVRYLGKFLWPRNLCIYYPLPGHWPAALVQFSAAFLLVVSLLVWKTRRRQPWLMVGWFWYLGTLAPVIGLVQLCAQSIADRYTYVPLIGIYLCLVWGLGELTRQRQRWIAAASAMAVLAAMACAVMTRYEIGFWSNSETVWKRAIAVTSDNYDAHNCLAVVLQPTQPGQAMSQFREAVKINFDAVVARRKLASTTGMPAEIIAALQAIAGRNPADASAQNDLGVALLQGGQVEEAIACFRRALHLKPDYCQWKNLDMALRFRTQLEDQKHPALQKH